MYSGAKTCGLWALLVILVWGGQPVPAQSRTERAITLNLRDYGWQPPDRHEINSPSIAVDHQGRVLVGFTVRERAGLVTRSQPSLGLRIVRFSHDGKMDLSLSLPTNAAGRTGIYLSDTDQIIARANDNLQLLKADEGNPQGGWEVLAPCTQQCSVVQSVTRHSLRLYTPNANPPPTLIHLSPQPILKRCGKAEKLIESNDDMMQNYPAISDELAYSSLDGNVYRWPLCDYEHRVEMPLRIRGPWIILSDQLFVLDTLSRDENWGLEVVSSDGQVKFRPDMAKHESIVASQAIRSSERGDRIAVDIVTLRGGNRRLDISARATARRIAVYDVNAGKEVASMPASIKHRYRLELGLSPDGHRLAILEDDIVRVVDVDITKPEQQH
ncbi:MAG: hypothetical protein WCD06_18050 [Candidatus Sulfotelmatobacter sp.]